MSLPHRFRSFSLRTLMVLFTLACITAAWLASERQLVRTRQAHRAKLEAEGKVFGTAADNKAPAVGETQNVRWSRRIFGDEAIQFILAVGDLDDRSWQSEAHEAFPESKFLLVPLGQPNVKRPKASPTP